MSTQNTEYLSLRKFSIGNPAIDIPKNASLYFDGYTLTLQGRPPVPLPQLRGAISAGWLIEASMYQDGMQAPLPQSANIMIRPADGGNPMNARPRIAVTMAQEEEREVGTIRGHARAVQNINNGVVVEQQDGVPVRHLGRPNVRGESTELTASNANRAIEASKARPVQPGQGRTRDEIMAQMDPAARANYEAQINMRKSAYTDVDERVAVPPTPQYPVHASDDHQGTVVATVMPGESSRKATREGISAPMTVGGGIETIDLGGGGGAPVETRKVIREGIVFTETNGPKVGVSAVVEPEVKETDPRRMVAKAVCRDFPALYDFDAPVKKKVARIQADFEDRPDIIRACFAAENDEMKARLTAEFPSAFE